MTLFRGKAVVLLTAVMLAFAAMPAGAATMQEEPSSTAIIFDVLITRPLGIVATAVGAAVFVVGLPFTIPTRSVGLAADKLVVDPLAFTFRRPVGQVDSFNGFDEAASPKS